MARFTRLEVYQAMFTSGLVPLFYNPDVEVSKNVAQACAAGGARVLEFTNRGDFAFDVFRDLSQSSRSRKIPVDPGCWFGSGCPHGSDVSSEPAPTLSSDRSSIPRWRGCATAGKLPICRAAVHSTKSPPLKNTALKLSKSSRGARSVDQDLSKRCEDPIRGHPSCPPAGLTPPKKTSAAGSKLEPVAWAWVPS